MEKGTSRRTLRERFEARVIRGEGCWMWAGAHDGGTGYAVIAVKRDGKWQPVPVHRVSYELLVGEIPPRLELDHLCHTQSPDCRGGRTCPHRGCVNPAHLEPVTGRINFLRSNHPSAVAVQTGVCGYGHLLAGTNIIRKSNGTRECRACVKRRNDLRPRLSTPQTLRQRFDTKYVARGDGCWEWTGAVLGAGYGAMRVDGKTVTARRVAYELHKGQIPSGARVSQTCGNRSCVNPTHLRLKGGHSSEGG